MRSVLTIEEISLEIASGIACALSQVVPDGVLHLRPFSVTDKGRLSVSGAPRIPHSAVPANKMRFEVGDILFNNTNSAELVGKSAVFSTALDASFSNHMTRVRVDRKRAEPGYVQAYLLHLYGRRFFQDRATRWVSQAAFGTAQLRALEIPLPPLDEQRRIVGLLDQAAEIRRRADDARAKARAIIPALFLDTFGDPATNPKGWPVRPLCETATFFGGATLPAGVPFAGQGGGYLLCKVSTLSLEENRNGIVSSMEWSAQPLARSAVAPVGSILFPKRGAAIATNKKRLLLRSGALDPNLMGVLGKPECYIPGFLLSLFEAFDLMSIASGSTVPQLNKQDLYPLDEIVPPLQLQTDFAEWADRLESVARHLDAAAAKAVAMAVGLSAEVFSASSNRGNGHG